MSNCKKHKINNVNHYSHLTPDTDCTCEGTGGSERGAGQGPATDPALTAKSQAPLKHPQTPPATGPAGDPELLAKRREPLKHPETPEATGPAK